ncbi:MAG: universal stress protein [Dehalococcoidales bacterium]|nr:universal stress protein [Dehalococcoidales bacterium]
MIDIHRILVPVVGDPADEEAMQLACFLAKKNKAKIWAVYVIQLMRSLPVDAEVDAEISRGEAILDHIEKVAEEMDYNVETDLLQARDAGPTIVEEASDHNVDLIIMGIRYKRRLGQFSLGDVGPYVLKNASCRVILYQQ